MVRGEQQRRAEALDLQRTRRLPDDAVPDAVRREREERDDDHGHDRRCRAQAEQRLAPAARTPDVGDRRRDHDRREGLGRDPEPERGEPEPLPPGQHRREPGHRQEGRPEVVAVEDHRAERERREREEAERRRRPLGRGTELAQRHRHRRQRADPAERHQDLELAVVEREARLADRRDAERRQRARRVLDREVAVGHVAVRDRRAVAVVLDRVEDQVVLVPAPVEQRHRDEKEPGRSDEEPPRLSRRRPALGEDAQVALGRGHEAARRPARARRRRRTGRTTAGRGRTSASARARSRAAARR